MLKIASRICKNLNKNQNKRLYLLISIFLLCAHVFAHNGILSGEKQLRVSKTKWFDIIYPARCEQSASILYEKADAVYEEVTAQYGFKPSFRMPVVITPAVDDFNAFWTSVPYNHIAIYDTGTSGASELSVFSETLLSTFRHELTHAVTYNMKSSFWQSFGKIFGDCVAPGMLTVTTGMAEGATVTSESAAGEGRLNDEYAKHYVKQAKIEAAFPSYHDVSGAADVLPGGAPYYFNGAFHQWLQENYGMQAYAEFWFRVVNGQNLTVSGAFRKAFGIKLKKAWALFEEAYEVPEVAANPVEAGEVRDFFEPESAEYSILNDAGSKYGSLTVSGGGETSAPRLVWVDYYGGRVQSAQQGAGVAPGVETLNNESSQHVASPAPSIETLFTLRGISGVRLSNDGRFLAASYISDLAATETARVKIYDFETGALYSVKDSGLKEAVVVRGAVRGNSLNDGGAAQSVSGTQSVSAASDWYLLAQKYSDQHYSIAIYRLALDEQGRKIKATEPCAEVVMGTETNPYAFTPLSDGTFAWLKKSKLSYSLCVSAVDGTLLREYAFPEGMVVRSLSYSENEAAGDDGAVFLFSYAQKGTLPRLGRLYAKDGRIVLSDADISGGVFEPVYWNGQVVYVGEFYRQSRLLCMDLSGGAAGYETLSVSERTGVGYETSVSTPTLLSNIPSTPYHSAPYLLRGILIPVSRYQTDYFGINADYVSNAAASYLGFTYITANPWTEGSSDLYTLTAGWNTLSNAYGVDLQITSGTATSLLQSFTELKSEFDSNGWKQGGGNLTLSTSLDFSNYSTITLQNAASALFGKQDTRIPEIEGDETVYSSVAFWDDKTFGITAPQNNTIYYMLQNISSVIYSNIRRTGAGRFEYGGFGFGVSYGFRYDSEFTEQNLEYVKASGLGAVLKIYLPHLLPFRSRYGYTYNLPLRLNAAYNPSSSIYGYTQPKNVYGRALSDATVETTLFSVDIQKAMPGISAVYLNDLYISAGYANTIMEESFQPDEVETYALDSVYIKGGLEFTPNVGVFARPAYKIGLISTCSYVLHSPEFNKISERIRLSVGLDMSF